MKEQMIVLSDSSSTQKKEMVKDKKENKIITSKYTSNRKPKKKIDEHKGEIFPMHSH
jgi:hypothetical protein